jgi:hypothetical protein
MNLPSLLSPLYIYIYIYTFKNQDTLTFLTANTLSWRMMYGATTTAQRRSCRRHHPRRCGRGRRTADPIAGSVILSRCCRHPRTASRRNQTASRDSANNRTGCILLRGRTSHRRRSSSQASLPRNCTDAGY